MGIDVRLKEGTVLKSKAGESYTVKQQLGAGGQGYIRLE